MHLLHRLSFRLEDRFESVPVFQPAFCYDNSTFSVIATSEIFSAGISTFSAPSSCFHFNSPLYPSNST